MTQNHPLVWSLPEIELTQTHHYTSSSDPQSIHWDWVQEYLDTYSKPTLVGEFGIHDYQEVDPSGISLHNSLWASAMSGSFGTAMSWWWDNWIEPNYLYVHFNALSAFMSAAELLEHDYEPERLLCHTTGSSDLIIAPGYTTWGQAPENNFTIHEDGSMSPPAAFLGQYLFGALWNTEHRNPPTFNVVYPDDGYFRVITGANTGQSPTIRIRLNGAQIYNAPVQVNTVVEVPIPAGSHAIQVSNQGTDWIQINSYAFSGLSSQLRGFGLVSPERILGWIQNREYNWYVVHENGVPDPAEAGTVELVLNPGIWQITWRDCLMGSSVAQEEVIADEYTVHIDIPDVLWDLSFDLIFIDDLICLDGDVTGDLQSDILDVVVLVAHILNTAPLDESVWCHVDFNEDGSLDVLDVVALVDFILG